MSIDSVNSIRDVITPSSYLGKGMAWPPREDPATGDFARAEAEGSISDCLLHLIHTTVGEYTSRTSFGTRVDEILFSAGDTGFIDEIFRSMKAAITRFEKRVTVLDISYDIIRSKSQVRIEAALRYRVVETGKSMDLIIPPITTEAA